MKKITITLLLVLSTVFTQAQLKGGATALYGTGIESLGFGVKATYGINEKFTGSGEINYFVGQSEESSFVKSSTSLTSIDLDAHYYFDTKNSKFNFYGIGGLNISIITSKVEYDQNAFGGFGGLGSDYDNSYNEIGLNIGAGFLYPLTDKLELVTEATYTLNDFDQLVLQAGILYTFKK